MDAVDPYVLALFLPPLGGLVAVALYELARAAVLAGLRRAAAFAWCLFAPFVLLLALGGCDPGGLLDGGGIGGSHVCDAGADSSDAADGQSRWPRCVADSDCPAPTLCVEGACASCAPAPSCGAIDDCDVWASACCTTANTQPACLPLNGKTTCQCMIQ